MSKISRKGLIRKLDRIFSEYIRKRDANKKGLVKCISCQKEYHFTEVDAGHFISRKEMSIRYHPKNVHAQCRFCNRFRYGMQYVYSLELEKKEEGLPKHLYNLSKKTTKYTMSDLQDLVDLYQDLLKKENKRLSL